MEENRFYMMALTSVDGVGDAVARQLIAYCGSAKAVFEQRLNVLQKIPGIGKVTASGIRRFRSFKTVETEYRRQEKKGIRIICYLEREYPARLRNFEDSPLVLFYKGNADMNAGRIISVVGTRRSTSYGRNFTEEFIAALKPYGVLVVSGLASGTDTNVHRACVANQIPTIGVLGHGFGTMYPSGNRSLAVQMEKNGGVLTEFFYHTPGSPENFPRRNRIVAGLCDTLVVVESGERGGSLITAKIANEYGKDVFAVPGRIGDQGSRGCNDLIRSNGAGIISSISHLMFDLNLHESNQHHVNRLYVPDTPEEASVSRVLKEGKTGIDSLYLRTGIDMGKLSLVLIEMEMKGVITVLPGKVYEFKGRM